MVRTRGEFAREQDERKLVVGDNCREFIEQYDLVHPFLGDRDSEELEEKWEKGSVQVMSNNYFSKSFSFLSFLSLPPSFFFIKLKREISYYNCLTVIHESNAEYGLITEAPVITRLRRGVRRICISAHLTTS